MLRHVSAKVEGLHLSTESKSASFYSQPRRDRRGSPEVGIAEETARRGRGVPVYNLSDPGNHDYNK